MIKRFKLEGSRYYIQAGETIIHLIEVEYRNRFNGWSFAITVWNRCLTLSYRKKNYYWDD
jgi:hypothetical protein